MSFVEVAQRLLLKGHPRTVKAKVQILYSLFFKVLSIVVGLVLVPLILNYLDAERYGIWLTLSSIITWVSFFDVGLGNGLRNRFAEAIAKGDDDLARIYVSTTYVLLACVFFVILVIFYVINRYLSWQDILNTKIISNEELSTLALVVFIFFILRFFFKLIGNILLADQRPGVNNSFAPLGNLLSLLIIYILTRTTHGSLIRLAAVLSITPVVVLIFATLIFFHKDYRKYIPSCRHIDLSKSRDLMGLGVKFFYIQIASIVFYSTTNFLIAQFSNQESVTAYNVAYKYLVVAYMGYSIILAPFWSAVTDAYSRGDYAWLRHSLSRLNKLSIAVVAVLVIQLLISPYVYKIWIGSKLNIPLSLSAVIAVYVVFQVLLAPSSYFVNGFGRLKVETYLLTAEIILFPFVVFFLGRSFGAVGVVLCLIVVQLPLLIVYPYHARLLINNEAGGIWNK